MHIIFIHKFCIEFSKIITNADCINSVEPFLRETKNGTVES